MGYYTRLEIAFWKQILRHGPTDDPSIRNHIVYLWSSSVGINLKYSHFTTVRKALESFLQCMVLKSSRCSYRVTEWLHIVILWSTKPGYRVTQNINCHCQCQHTPCGTTPGTITPYDHIESDSHSPSVSVCSLPTNFKHELLHCDTSWVGSILRTYTKG